MPLSEPLPWTEGCPPLVLLSAYSLGKLPTAVVERVATHLPDCKHCETLLHDCPEEDSLIKSLRRCALGDRPTGDRQQASPGSQATVPDVNALYGAAAVRLPARLGQYELLELLGRGGMGVVYKARQVPLNRIVAVKLALGGPVPGTEAFVRFQVESAAIARLQHDNIVRVYECGEHDGRPYFSMDYVEGSSLAQKLSGTPLSEREAASLVQTLARAVHFAHQHQIIHRDLKPANVLISPDGAVKLTDFGLAKLMDAEEGQTQTHGVMGTASYMAPEQARGDSREIGPLADVYGLGAILYEALTGRPPFKAADRAETLEQVQSQDPLPPSRLRGRMSCDLEAVCLKCLEKKPQRRYTSAEALADDLGRWMRGESTLVRPFSWPRRAWRVVRRHAIISTAAFLLVLVVLAGIITPVVNYLRHPDRQLERIQQKLEEGRLVTLIPEAGPPVWFRPVTGPGKMRTFAAADGTFSVETRQLALVELLPDPKQQCYRFSVEVRHDDCFTYEGGVGIYFAHSKCATVQDETVHFFYGMYFNDRIKLSKMFPRLPPVGNRLELAICRYREPEAFSHGVRLASVQAEFEPAEPFTSLAPWRKIAVKVTPKEIQAFWEDKAIGARSRSRMMKAGENLAVNFVDPRDVNRKFALRDGLGLYVYRGVASFRRIVVEPLVEEN